MAAQFLVKNGDWFYNLYTRVACASGSTIFGQEYHLVPQSLVNNGLWFYNLWSRMDPVLQSLVKNGHRLYNLWSRMTSGATIFGQEWHLVIGQEHIMVQ